MKKVLMFLMMATLVISLNSCGDNCDPGQLPLDDNLNVIITNSNGTAYIKYANNILPDSIKVFNLATNATVTRSLFGDSILLIEGYTVTNNAVTRYKIEKGPNAKPDTIEVTVGRRTEQDACARDFDVARFSSIKFNGTTVCTTCAGNTAYTYKRR